MIIHKKEQENFIKLKRRVIRKFQNLTLLNTQYRIMDFLQANEEMKNGKRVTRKNWEKAHYLWHSKTYDCVLSSHTLGEQDIFMDTHGYIFMCRGTDIEALDWELYLPF